VDETNPTADLHFDTPEDAAEGFLKGWEAEDNESSPSPPEEDTEAPESTEQEDTEGEEEEAVDSEEVEEDPEEDSEETEDEDEEEESTSKKKVLDDDSLVEVKVDDEVLKVSVKDLKRLYGQEASLTKKSQQVAATRKSMEQEALKTAAVLDKMYKKAEERWKPYSEVDMLLASKQLDSDQSLHYAQKLKLLGKTLNLSLKRLTLLLRRARLNNRISLKKLLLMQSKYSKRTSLTGIQTSTIPFREYAVNHGMPSDMVNSLVDPVAIQIIHKARLYDEAKKIVTKKKILSLRRS
jgi:hypothetical protein